MIRKIFFLLHTPLTKRDYDRFGVDIFLARGFKVIFLDLTAMLHQGYAANIDGSQLSGYKEVVSVRKPKDAIVFLKNNLGAFGISLNNATAATAFLYRAFRKYDISYAVFNTNDIPKPFVSVNKAVKLVKKLCNSADLKWISNTLLRYSSLLPACLSGMQPPSFVFLGGFKAGRVFPAVNADTVNVWAHTLDYDLYLEYVLRSSRFQVSTKYAVFLDEFFPLHPDFCVSESLKKPYGDYLQYYREMNKIFDIIEDKLGVPVVIAAHPKSSYENMPPMFADRQVIKGKTTDLVAGADYVLAHASTSVNFAVLFNKPILFIMPNGVRGGYYEDLIKGFAAEFLTSPADINSIKDIDFKQRNGINRDAYLAYKENYIKRKGTPEKYFWDVCLDAIEPALN